MRRALADRIVRFGAATLTDPELVGVLIGRHARLERDVVARADARELASHGLRSNEVARLLATVELGRRLIAPNSDAVIVTGPEVLHDLLASRVMHEEREHVIVVSVNRRRRVLAIDTVSIGSSGFTIVDPGVIFRTAIRRGADAVALVHNHPSGDPTPSREDIEVTRRVVAAGRVVGITLLDHVVVGREGWRSIGAEAGIAGNDGVPMVAS